MLLASHVALLGKYLIYLSLVTLERTTHTSNPIRRSILILEPGPLVKEASSRNLRPHTQELQEEDNKQIFQQTPTQRKGYSLRLLETLGKRSHRKPWLDELISS